MATSTTNLPSIGNLLVRERYTSDSFTVSAYSQAGKELTITKSGYTPLGVVGLWAKANANTLYYNFRLGNSSGNGEDKVTVSVKNHTSGAIDGQFAVDILYVKN